MLLAGDIGGTKTNLAIYSLDSGCREPLLEQTFPSDDYDGLESIVKEFNEATEYDIDRAVIGVAGPVVDGTVRATNLPWVMSEEGLKKALDIEKVKLLNDLEATAYGILELNDDELVKLNDVPHQDGHKAIIAPGTGLGEGILCYHEGKYIAMSSEGGHTDFGPTSLIQVELSKYLLGKLGHISYERVCSGIGIPNIYDYFKSSGVAPEKPEIAEQLRDAEDPTPIIVQAALDGTCELSIETLNLFTTILGAKAGNLALTIIARGGVYLGGGIPPRIVSKLKDGTFMAAFLNKGRFADVLSKMPVYVILNSKTAMLGAASYGLAL